MPVESNEKLSRKERERETHRLEILAAAERVFVRDGYFGTTVESIAKEAEFAVGTLYNFFPGKEELYTEVISKTMEEFLEPLQAQVLSLRDPEAAIGALIELQLEFFEKHRGLFRVLVETFHGDQKGPVPKMPGQALEMFDKYIDMLKGLFERGVRSGAFEDYDPLYLALALHGIIHSFTMYWSRHEPAEPLDARVKVIRDGFLKGICATRPASAPTVEKG
jgi:AcrR family transcriptional regulator